MQVSRRMTRRRLLGATAAASGTLWLAACRGSGNKDESTGAPTVDTSAKVSTATPKKGGVLRASQPADIAPRQLPAQFSPSSNAFVTAVFDLLVGYDPDVKPMPRLATSWEWAPDYLQLTLKLRPNVKFHSGRTFTSEDAAYTIERLKSVEVNSQWRQYAALMKPQTPDPTTLVIKYDLPRKSSFDALAGTFIVDRETIDHAKDGKQFVGTGPFRFKEWAPGDHVTVVRNPDYWQEGKPYLDQIDIKVLPDAQSATLSLETGATDFMQGTPGLDIQRLQKDKKYQPIFAEAAGKTFFYVGIDVKGPGLADKRVRQAIGYAMDRQRLIDTALYGFGRPASTFWPENSFAYDKTLDQTYTRDVQKAKQLLQAAGWDANTNLAFKISLAYPPAIDMGLALQPDLTSAGMKMTVDRMDNTVWTNLAQQRQIQGAWITPISLMQLSPATFPFAAGAVKNATNNSNFESPLYGMLIDQALSTTDDQKLKEIMKQITQLILDEAWVVPIVDSQIGAQGGTVARASVKNLTWDMSYIAHYRWEDVWLE